MSNGVVQRKGHCHLRLNTLDYAGAGLWVTNLRARLHVTTLRRNNHGLATHPCSRELAVSHIEKVILYALASRVDEAGECCPSLETLAKDTGLARRTLQYHLNALIEAHSVSREERRGATTILRLHLCERSAPASGSPVQDGDADMRDVHHGVHATDEIHAPRAPEVKKELPLNPQELPGAREISTTRASDSQNCQNAPHISTTRASDGQNRQTQEPPWSAAAPWWTTEAGIDRKGRELNVAPRPGEPYSNYKRRLLDIEHTARRSAVARHSDTTGCG